MSGALRWTDFDDRRLKALVFAMLPYPKILAEFSGHSANAVRDAWDRLFCQDGLAPLDRAIYVLGDRAKRSHTCATGLRLDGRPASTAQIVEAANSVLEARRLAPISYVGCAAR